MSHCFGITGLAVHNDLGKSKAMCFKLLDALISTEFNQDYAFIPFSGRLSGAILLAAVGEVQERIPRLRANLFCWHSLQFSESNVSLKYLVLLILPLLLSILLL